MFVPFVGIINPAFLDPPVEIGAGDFVGRVQCGMIRCQKSHRSGFVGHALVRKMQSVRRKLIGFQVATRPVILRDDIAAGLNISEQRRQMRNEIRADIESANTNDDGIKRLQFLGCEVRSGQCGDLVTHVRQALSHAVAGAGKVTDVFAANGQVQAHGLETRRRLQHQQRNMREINHHTPVVIIFPGHFHLGGNIGCRRLRRCGYGECELCLVSIGFQMERCRGGNNVPARWRIQMEGTRDLRPLGGDVHDHRPRGAGRKQTDIRSEFE